MNTQFIYDSKLGDVLLNNYASEIKEHGELREVIKKLNVISRTVKSLKEEKEGKSKPGK